MKHSTTKRIWQTRVTESRLSPTQLRREVHVTELGREVTTAFWIIEGPEEVLPSPLQRHDLAIGALLFKAMKEKADLHVEGPVSRILLENAQEFMQIWSLWCPRLYTPVSISADEEVRGPRQNPNRQDSAVCAFSGGVDASATVWRHHAGLADRMTRKLRAAVLVHGFDIPLENQGAFDLASRLSATTLRDVNVPFVSMKTNWKSDICVDWEMEFALGILSCLRQWDDDVDTLLVGSCEDYARLVVPWGSHPLPTRLLAGEDSRIVYDGGHLTRTEKVALISQWPAGYDSLRVCWEGDITGKNCGQCEKCIRTKMNAVASGAPIPRSLGGRPTLAQVASVGPFNEAQRLLMVEVLDEAKKNGIDDPLLLGVAIALQRNKRRQQLKRLKRALKKMACAAARAVTISVGWLRTSRPRSSRNRGGARVQS